MLCTFAIWAALCFENLDQSGAKIAIQETKLISQETYKFVNDFFERNDPAYKKVIVRRALLAYVEASRDYRKQKFNHCQDVINELWRDYPKGDKVWWEAVRSENNSFELGQFPCYAPLIMLEEACRWKLNPDSVDAISEPIVLEIVMFGKSMGLQPRNKADLANGNGVQVTHTLNPAILADNYKIPRNAVWLFQEYVLAITKGKARLELDFLNLPDQTINVRSFTQQNKAAKQFFAGSDLSLMTKVKGALPSRLTKQPDWWWAIVPSHNPDNVPDFKNTLFVTGGMGGGPDGVQPWFEIDDLTMVRRGPGVDLGMMEPIEVETLMGYWFQHEFYHHLFGRFSEYSLEKEGHIWFQRNKWPSDFVGTFEADYYQEALHRRIQTTTKNPLNARVRYSPPPAEMFMKLDLRRLLGTYRLEPVDDPWKLGEITYQGRDSQGNPILKWTNSAKVSWLLYPRMDQGALLTGGDNPFLKQTNGVPLPFKILFARDDNGKYTNQILGYSFQGETFVKDR